MQLSWGALSLGWREGLLALIIVVIVYMLWLLARMRRIGRPGKVVPSQPQEPQVRAEPAAPIAAADAAEAEPFWSGDGADSVRLAQEAFMAGVERELEQLREEMDALRGALAGLREDVAALSQTFEQEIHAHRAAQQASPLYSDAMQMALLGHDALTIAERCGIARAEAELVVALAKSQAQ